MAEAISVSGPISGSDKTLRFETGKLALQSQGAVVASIGKTTCSSPQTPQRAFVTASTFSR